MPGKVALMDHRPMLFLVPDCGRDVGGYRSGRSRERDIPDTFSTWSTRSGGTRPLAIQPEILPCDFRPNSRAKALCPSTASTASSSASLLMSLINAQDVNRVNAWRGNTALHNPLMGKQAESEGSEFWQRLVEAWGPRGLPVSQNGVAAKLGMKGNGSTRRWFTGETVPEMGTLAEIAKLGNVTIDWLLTSRFPKHPIEPGTVLGDMHAAWAGFNDTDIAAIATALEGRVAVASIRALTVEQPTAKGRVRR